MQYSTVIFVWPKDSNLQCILTSDHPSIFPPSKARNLAATVNICKGHLFWWIPWFSDLPKIIHPWSQTWNNHKKFKPKRPSNGLQSTKQNPREGQELCRCQVQGTCKHIVIYHILKYESYAVKHYLHIIDRNLECNHLKQILRIQKIGPTASQSWNICFFLKGSSANVFPGWVVSPLAHRSTHGQSIDSRHLVSGVSQRRPRPPPYAMSFFWGGHGVVKGWKNRTHVGNICILSKYVGFKKS